MVAIFTGSGLGLERGSGMVLGARGLLGQSSMGRAGENVFVNAATGNLIISRTDEMLLGMGPDAVLTRTYNSLGAFTDENDDNWRFGASRRVHSLTGTVGQSGSTITRTDWDGSETVYSWDTTASVYRSTDGAGAYDTLTFGSSVWTWQDGDSRTTEVYDNPASGVYRLASQTDTDGKVVTFAYNASGFVEKVTTASVPSSPLVAPYVEYIQLSYTGDNVTEITTYHQADGDNVYETIKRVRYGYDASDRLTSVTVDLSPGDGVVADGNVYAITYGYDGSDRINLITQTDGSSLAITYNGAGKVETLTQTAASGVTRVTSFTYNANSTVITDPFSQTTTLNYDAAGNLTSMVTPPAVSGGTAQTYAYTYDSATGDVLTVVDPSGKTTEYSYDANGNRLTERDAAGNTVIRTFGSNNQLLTESRYLTPDTAGGGLSPADPLTTRYSYDSENHLRYIVTAEGRVTEYRYDAAGQLTSTIEYAGNAYDVSALAAGASIAEGTLDTWVGGISDKSMTKRTDIAYTFRGAIDTVTSYGVVLSSGVGDTSATTEITKTVYIYDQAGNLLSRKIDGANTAETYLYDGLNRITATTDYSGLTTTMAYGDAASTTTVTVGGSITRVSTYNLAGELISQAESATGLSAVTTLHRYDALGRLRSVTDPTGVKTYLLYDRTGRKVGEVDGTGALTEFRYNADNELVSTTRYKTLLSSTLLAQLDSNTANMTYELAAYRPSSDAADIWEWRVYDAAHRLIETINGAGAAIVYEYDGASRLVKTTAYANLIASGTVTGYKTTGPTALVTPTADAGNDRVARTFYDKDGRLIGTLDAEGYLTQVVYDAAGQRVQTIAFSGATSTTYRASGTYAQLLGSVTVDTAKDIHIWSVYDQRGLLRATIDGEGGVVRYHYTAQGFLDQEIRGQKLSASELNTYLGGTGPTLANLPAAAGGTVLETTAWTRDRYGRVLSEVRTLTSGTETDVYLYDSAGRLLTVTTATASAAARTRSYFYDARGRLIAELGGEGSAVLAAHGNRRYDQTLVGTSVAETLTGGAGNDLIQGLAGNDILYGLGGDDRLEGGAGADRLEGGDGNDVLVAGINNDVNLYGGKGRDVFVFMSGDGADTIQDFEVGVDLIDLSALGGYVSMAASGADTIITLSNAGTVTVKNVAPSLLTAASFIFGGYDQVTVGTGSAETINGTAGRDLIQGLAGNDTLNGYGGDDRLEGGVGVDTLNGHDGDDILVSGTSNDINLSGGTGRDIFVFLAGDGADRILDFQVGVDLIDLSAIGSYVSITASGANTVITLATGSITVNNVTPAQLTASHIILSPQDVAKTYGATYSYDDGDRLVAKTTSDGAGSTLNKTLYYYDADGRLTHEINALGEVVEHRYDAFGRQTDVIAHATRLSGGTLATLTGGLVNSTLTSAVSALANSAIDSKVQTTFNVTGTVASTIDAEAATSTYSYNAFNELVSQLAPISSGVTRETTRVYDRRGLMTSTTLDAASGGLQLLTTITYDAFGRALRAYDPTQDTLYTATTYDRAGRVVTTTDTMGGVTSYTYDGRGAVLTVTDRLSNATTFAYTAFNRETTMTTPEGIVTKTTTDANGQTISVVEGHGTAEARTTSFVYDRDGRLKRTTDGVGNAVQNTYDAAGRLAFTVDARGIKTSFTYDAANRLLTAKVDDGTLNLVTTYEYDAKGQQTKVTDAAGRIVAYAFDRNGRTTTVTADPAGLALVAKYEYDQVGRQTKVTEAFGTAAARVTQYAYDKADRLSSTAVDPTGLNLTTSFAYDKRGNLVSRTDGAGGVTRFVYDREDRLIWTIDPVGGVTKTVYDVEGRATAKVVYATALSASTISGWLPDITDAEVTAGVSTAASDVTSRSVYDRDGRVRYSVDGLGHPTEYVYDAVGNVTRVIAYDGTIAPGSWTVTAVAAAITSGGLAAAAGTITTKAAYDGAGRQLFAVNGLGAVVQYAYDGAGNILSARAFATANYGGSGALSDLQSWATTNASSNDRIVYTAYDGAGRAIYSADAAGAVTQFTYDGSGNVVSVRAYASTTPYTDATTFTAWVSSNTNATADRITKTAYDAAGRAVYSADATGHVTALTYDQAGRVTRTVSYATATFSAAGTVADFASWVTSNANATLDRTSRVAYDAAGRAAFSIDAMNGVVRYSYDGAGRVTKALQFAPTSYSGDYSLSSLTSWASSNAANTGNRITRTLYDAAGQAVFTARLSDDNTTSYVAKVEYDGAGRVLSEIGYAGTYTVGDSTTAAALTTTIGTLPGTARVTAHAYDATGALAQTTNALGAVTKYTRDTFGQVTDQTVAFGTADAVSTRFAYDKTGRVTSQTRAYGATEATTDAYAYNAFGDLTDHTAASGSVDPAITHFVHDKAGRVTSETRGYGAPEASTTTYGLNAFGEATSITNPLSRVTTRTYDLMGRLLTETVPLTSSTSAVTTNAYNGFGELAKVTDARLNTGYFYYDRLGRLTRQVDPENYITDTTYSLGGEVLTVKRFYNRATTGLGSLTTPPNDPVAHAKDATTTIVRDKLDRVTKVTDAEGFFDQYVLNAFGDRITVTNKLAGVTTNTFDKLGQLTQESIAIVADYDGAGGASPTTTTVINTYEYDLRGNRTKAIEADNISADKRTTILTYDRLDRLKEEAGETVTVTAADLITTSLVTPTQKIFYDPRGNIRMTEDATGARTFYYHDDLNRKIKEVSALGTLSVWEYDAASNVQKAIVYGDAVALPSSETAAAPTPVNSANRRETTYGYDYNNRLVSTTIAGVQVGSFNGTNYVTSETSIVTGVEYDAMGNVVVETDGAGNRILHFYDKRGRAVAKVDQENYLTSYTLDAEGNVLKEERFATKLTGTVTKDSVAADLRTSVAGGAADRTTDFEYDRAGRRTKEIRLSVASASVDSGGAMTTATASATIEYTYNALGLVTQKKEATGDYVDFNHDSSGREITATTSAFTDHAGASVQRRTETLYNGVNQVTQTREGKIVADSAVDRITQYAYDGAGRLSSVTDATGFVRNYAYDAAGRVVKESYSRLKSDGTSVTEANAYQYDALGRVKLQAVATDGGSSWTFGDKTHIRYNVFGEVTGKGVTAGSASTPVYQETYEYDAAGRMWKSNTGDGSTRLYVHDAAGNATLMIGATTTDLSGYASIGAALAALGTSGATGETALAGIAPTVTVYDKRGMATSTREAFRELSSSSASNLIVRSRTYNAFGEVATETDARGNVTDFSYNTMGRLTQKQAPTVNYTAENGAITSGRPTENYYYDLGGRLVGNRDANGNLNRRTLLAHTGYGQSEALALAEYRAGGADSANSGVYQSGYDVLGNLRKRTNELGVVTTQEYDKLGRLTAINHPTRTSNSATLKDEYTYDGLGQRITHSQTYRNVDTIDLDGDTNVTELTPWVTNTEKTDYDAQGRVVKFADYAGRQTLTSYAWNATLATTGLGTFGGHTKTTTHVSGLTAVESLDYFGRLAARSDLGGHTYAFTFDAAGRQITQTSSVGQSIAYSYFDTGQVASITDGATAGLHTLATYGYDADGNRLTEKFVQKSGSTVTATYQDAIVTWDAMNRMTTFDDTGNGTVSVDYEYDAQGNIRHMLASYPHPLGSGSGTQDYWYKYDSMNRFVVTKGSFTGTRGSGSITKGTLAGRDVYYDAAGQRVMVARYKGLEVRGGAWVEDWSNGYAEMVWEENVLLGYADGETREFYTYGEDGYLETVRIGESTVEAPLEGGVEAATVTHPTTGPLRATDVRDGLGRIIDHAEYLPDGQFTYGRKVKYDAAGLVTWDDVINRKEGSADVYHAETSYTYTALSTGGGVTAGAFLGGVSTYSETVNYKIGHLGGRDNSPHDTSITTTFQWWDGAVQSHITYDRNIYQGGTVLWTTDFAYDLGGKMTWADIDDGRDREVFFVNDANGQVMKRWEVSSLDDPFDNYFYFNGRRIGETSNNGATDRDYATMIAARDDDPPSGTTAAFRYGQVTPHADFDQSYNVINAGTPGAQPSSYTVEQGDSLRSIAQAVWGDGALWYIIAEANGLTAASELAAGITLTIPAHVANVHNTSETFRPYDPNKAMGNVSPTQPKPAKKPGGCGAGAIFIAIIAVVVVAIIAPHAIAAVANLIGGAGTATVTGLGMTGVTFAGAGTAAAASASTILASTVIGGAIAGAAGSIVSQAIGVATGLQDKFSWNAVGLAAIGSAVGAGVGLSPLKGIEGVFGAAVRGAVSSTITQAVGVATGLQKKFDWAGVAVSAIAAGVAERLTIGGFAEGFGETGQSAINNFIGGVAGVAARSLVEGSDFGDNLIAALPDIVGNTVGDLIVGALSAPKSADEAIKRRLAAVDMQIADLQAQRDAALKKGDQTAVGNIDATLAVISDRDTQVQSAALEYARVRFGKTKASTMTLGEIVGPNSQYYEWTPAADSSPSTLESGTEGSDSARTSPGRATAYQGEAASTQPPQTNDDGSTTVETVVVTAEKSTSGKIKADPETPVGRVAVDIAVRTKDTVESIPEGYRGAAVAAAKTVITGGAGPFIQYGIDQGINAAIPLLPSEVLRPLADASHKVNDFIGAEGGGFLLGVDASKVKTGDREGVAWAGTTIIGISVTKIVSKITRTLNRRACFAAGTLVHTQGGLKAIERVQPGDLVWSRLEGDAELAGWKRVIDHACTGQMELYEVSVSTPSGQYETYRTTELHPFWVEKSEELESGQFVAAGDLAVGDQVRLADGGAAYVSGILATGLTEPVYNFTVEGWHTYHVGELGVWVHNDNCLDRILTANRPNAQDPRLNAVYNQLWRPQDTNPGGTAGELVREAQRGDAIPRHLQKAEERARELAKLLADRKTPLQKLDRAGAQRVLDDLRAAIRTAKGK